MAKTSKTLNPMMTGKQLSAMFLVLLVAHSLVMYLANQWFPNLVVLGTHIYSPFMGLIYSMVVFTLIVVGSVPVIEHVGDVLKKRLSDTDWMILYLLINAVGMWIVSRFAEQLGMGISSWRVVVLLAVILDVVQGVFMMGVVSKVK